VSIPVFCATIFLLFPIVQQLKKKGYPMLPTNVQAIVLAAGKATRFKTGKTKLLEKIGGQEMILYPTTMLERLKIPTTMVVGHQKDALEKVIKQRHANDIIFTQQKEQRGTGHALLCTRHCWQKDTILVLNGDMPLVAPQIIEQLLKTHQETKATISFVVAQLAHPRHSYGRVVKTEKGIKIVEAKDFTDDPKKHTLINAGIYLIDRKFLERHIDQIKKSKSNEFYLTDLVGMASDKKQVVSIVQAPFDLVRGVNTLEELWIAEQIKCLELIQYWMRQGVRFSAAQNVHIDIDVSLGAGTQIGGGVHLVRGTKIGINCSIQEYTRLENATIGDNCIIRSHSVITDSIVHENGQVGPFAHLRYGTVLKQNACVGNFVEIKKSCIGNDSKVKHLAYLGDTTVGNNVNIGAGTITCNHNGFTKEKTIIKDNAYIGSNNTLVAPVTIEENSFTAAGSTITNNVPPNTLALGRARQVNKVGYASKLRAKFSKQCCSTDATDQQNTGCCQYSAAIKTNTAKQQQENS